jgi:hypothetical protein
MMCVLHISSPVPAGILMRITLSRSQWPLGLRHELSALILCLCCPAQVKAMWQGSSLSEESYQLYIRLRNYKTETKIGIVGSGVQLGPLGTAATNRPIVPAPGDYDDGEIDGIIGKGNRNTRRKPGPVPLCPPQNLHTTRTWAAGVGSQRLTVCATARPICSKFNKRREKFFFTCFSHYWPSPEGVANIIK